MSCNAETRSKLRLELKQYASVLETIFIDKYGEPSFKKCIDVMTIERKFDEKGISFSQNVQGNIGRILRCFGDINFQLRKLTRMPEKDPK